MTHRAPPWILALLLCGLCSAAGTAHAQVNPFEDDKEAAESSDEPAPEKPAKKKTTKKEKEKKKTKKTDEQDSDAEQAPQEAAAKTDAPDASTGDAEPQGEAPTQEAQDEPPPDDEDEEPEADEEDDDDATADAVPDEPERDYGARVGLGQNFSRAEFITTGIVLPAGLTLAIAGPNLFGEPAASMTTPQLGSLDYRLSIKSHGDLADGAPFLFGALDIGGLVLPAAMGGFYLVSGIYLWAADQPLLASQSINIDHSMVAMAEVVGWTALTTGAIHLLVGRQRPYVAFQREAYGDLESKGANSSFISTPVALMFAMCSFAGWDYSDHLVNSGTGTFLGRVVPFTVLYGVSALVGYSGIYGQQHYFSDIAMSALLGSLIGNLVYVAHFEPDGSPRVRNPARLVVAPQLVSDGASARAGIGLIGSW